MAITKFARVLALLIVPAVLVVAALAQVAPGGSGATLTTSLAPGTVVWPGDVLEFDVEATNPQLDAVTLSLLDPPPGCMFTQQSKSAPNGRPSKARPGNFVTARGHARWLVPSNFGGRHRLTFRATDSTNPSQTLLASVDLRVEGGSAPTTIVIGDVTGDGVLDTVAGTIYATVSGTPQTGAVYVWNGVVAPSGAPDATLVVPGAAAYDWLGLVSGQGIQLADVTGDRVLDVLVGTVAADVGGFVQVGAIYAWEGGATLNGTPPPLATLTIAGATANFSLGSRAGQPIQLADVTGDGVVDLVTGTIGADVSGVTDAGALYVWKGGPSFRGAPTPVATLAVTGAIAFDRLGMSETQLVDVTNDGILDVVAGSPYADVAGVVDAGAVYVWKGGPTLVGTPAPLATLTVPGANTGDWLGYVGDPFFSLRPGRVGRIADVTGDGLPDLVVGAIYAKAGSVAYAGAIYVWQGGAALTGTPAPLATLVAPGASYADQLSLLGDTSGLMGQGLQLVDVTGDGLLDVVAGTSNADVGGVIDAGAVYVWQGGATLTGTPAPLATLTVSGATYRDHLGDALGQGLLFADMDGDGVRDIVAGARLADVGGVVDAGAIYAWQGGATLTGTPAPLATLTVPGAQPYDLLGSTMPPAGNTSGHGYSIQLADVTGDGQVDVVAGTVWADSVAGKTDSGAVYVWAGGPTFSGPLSPLATLHEQSGNTNDLLGATNDFGQGIQIAEVTGDGVLDVVTGSPYFDVGGVLDAGMILVFEGGLALSGTPQPLAKLRLSNRVAGDALGAGGGQTIQIADVTGDGVPDVVGSTRYKKVNGKRFAGGIYVWAGGATLHGTLDPLAELTDPSPTQWDYLASAVTQGYFLADVTGDGLLDLMAGSPYADVAKVADTGALYHWQGGASLVGAPQLFKLSVPGAVQSDTLTNR